MEQQLQLCLLDKELAEETARELRHELDDALGRIAELEELVELSSELEESLAREKELVDVELARALARVAELEAAQAEYNSVVSQQLDLRRLQRQLRAAELDLRVHKHGASVLADAWEDAVLPLYVDCFGVDLEPEFAAYKDGAVLGAEFCAQVRARLLVVLQTMPQAELRTRLSQIARLPVSEYTPHLVAALRRAHLGDYARQLENGVLRVEEPLAPAAEVRTLLARLVVLEAKLASAQSVLDEIQQLKTEHTALASVCAQQERELARLHEAVAEGGRALDALRRANLPEALAVQTLQARVAALQRVLQFYSGSRRAQPLTALRPAVVPAPFPRARIRALQRTVLSLRVVSADDPDARAQTVAQQLAVSRLSI